jgi:D-glycero-D-manno-heptose 1,7-bisphosphate phosphatase
MVKFKKAVFLDRDGVVNQSIIRNGKPYSPSRIEDVVIIEGASKAVSKLVESGFEVVVVTNQPDIARKKISFESIKLINNYIKEKTSIYNFYICPHDDLDNCECRKPNIGMLLKASEELKLNLSQSIMIGDRWKDIEAGQRAGCKCYFIDYKYNEKLPTQPFIEVESLLHASKLILGEGYVG